MCHRCETRASLPLDAIRHPRDTPIWKLEAAVRMHRNMAAIFCSFVSLIMCIGGEYRGVRHDRHFSDDG
jgi:hypothetical protein